MMPRQDHLAWCKQRALEYADLGDAGQAISSMVSDMCKHPDTERSAKVVGELGVMLALAGHLDTPAQIREWINGVG